MILAVSNNCAGCQYRTCLVQSYSKIFFDNYEKDKNEKFVKFKMGHGCIPNLKEKLDCSSSSGSPGQGPGLDCGCDPDDVAFKNIVGHGKAICTKPGKKSGKKSVWTLICGKC